MKALSHAQSAPDGRRFSAGVMRLAGIVLLAACANLGSRLCLSQIRSAVGRDGR